MAHAVLAAHEEHRHIGDRLHRLTVVPRAGRQPAHAHAFASNRALQLLDEPRCARRHAELLDALDLASEPALRGRGLDSGNGRAHRLLAQRIAGRAEVDGELHFARDDVDRAGLGLDAPDGADQLGIRARDALDGQHALGRGGQRIAAQLHRHGAGMAGNAGQ